MYPLLKNNEKIFCIKPNTSLKVNDIVVFNHDKEGLMIKEIRKIGEKGIYVKGTAPDSIDSSIFGYLQEKDILYKMLFKY